MELLLMKLLMELERLMKNAPARTPDQVRTTSTPPTWRAKDVGGNCPPRAPMGPEPLVCAVRGRREHEEQIEADARAVLPRFGPHGCVKPYSCLVVY